MSGPIPAPVGAALPQLYLARFDDHGARRLASKNQVVYQCHRASKGGKFMGAIQMSWSQAGRVGVFCTAILLAGCGQRVGPTSGSDEIDSDIAQSREGNAGTTLGQALRARRNEERFVAVNRYIWFATLEVLDFMPVQSIDPYTGVIVMGYGTPPGGGTSYRATVLISDPALDARSLNVALQTRGGTANASAVRAVEDAILTRARQLRVADSRL